LFAAFGGAWVITGIFVPRFARRGLGVGFGFSLLCGGSGHRFAVMLVREFLGLG
jgi:hypothetical protein